MKWLLELFQNIFLAPLIREKLVDAETKLTRMEIERTNLQKKLEEAQREIDRLTKVNQQYLARARNDRPRFAEGADPDAFGE